MVGDKQGNKKFHRNKVINLGLDYGRPTDPNVRTIYVEKYNELLAAMLSCKVWQQ
jgi:hypothetical protein